jgi:hypothetical protein
MPDMEVVAQKLVIASQYPNDFSGSFNYFSAQVSCLHGGAQLENSKYTKKCNVSAIYGHGGQAVEEDVVTLVVMVGLVVVVEVTLVDEAEVVMTGQILLMALMYQTQLKTLWMKNGGNLRIMVDGCMWLRLVNK